MAYVVVESKCSAIQEKYLSKDNVKFSRKKIIMFLWWSENLMVNILINMPWKVSCQFLD